MVVGNRIWTYSLLQASSRGEQHESGQAQLITRHPQPDVASTTFQLLDQRWGPHTTDRFATFQHARVHRFNARFREPLLEGVDALAHDRHNENNFFLTTLSSVTSGHRQGYSGQGCGNTSSARVARSAVVSKTHSTTGCSVSVPSPTQKNILVHGSSSRRQGKQRLDGGCLENLWSECFIRTGWPERAIRQFILALAASTTQSNDSIKKM